MTIIFQIMINFCLLFVNYMLSIKIIKLQKQISNYDKKINESNIKITKIFNMLFNIHKTNNELIDIKFEELEDKINNY